jgi:hypothetical protein
MSEALQIEGPYAANEKLFDTVDKALQTAIRVLEETHSSVSDDEYYVFLQLLHEFQLMSLCRCGAGRIAGVEEAIGNAMIRTDSRRGLDMLRAALWTADLGDDDKEDIEETVPDYRIHDITHLRTMLAYWRAGTVKREGAE